MRRQTAFERDLREWLKDSAFRAGYESGRERQYRWQELADYNGRVSKGIVHTPEYVERMRLEQEAFDKWAADGYPA